MATEHVWVSLASSRPDDLPEWPGFAESWLGAAAPRVPAGEGDLVDAALAFALQFADGRAVPGTGRTAELWETLATLAATDLAAARAVEPHLDALAILRQAGRLDDFPADASWGVFAAEGGVDPLLARHGAAGSDTAGATTPGWTLTGTKPWCSLADRLGRALVSATVDASGSGSGSSGSGSASSGVTVLPGTWHARGLSEVPSGPVHFDAVPAEPIGDADWYLDRPGFAWGGIGVAACWFGGAVGVGRMLAARARDVTDPLLQFHLGVVDERLGDARRALAEAAALVDSGSAVGEPGRLLAKRARATVARASEDVLEHVAHALGPAPLALDAVHAKRVADLELYLRQHHAEKDSVSLGRQLADTSGLPW